MIAPNQRPYTMNTTVNEQELQGFTIAKVAELLSVSQSTVRRMISNNELAVATIRDTPTRRVLRIPASEVARVLQVSAA